PLAARPAAGAVKGRRDTPVPGPRSFTRTRPKNSEEEVHATQRRYLVRPGAARDRWASCHGVHAAGSAGRPASRGGGPERRADHEHRFRAGHHRPAEGIVRKRGRADDDGLRGPHAARREDPQADPGPYFKAIAATWVGVPSRQDMVEKGGDKWTEPATFIGNGPFKLTEWKHNEKLVFERNDSYKDPQTGGAAKLKRWTKVMINEGAVAFAAYRNNELDAVGVAAEDLRTVDGDADLK